MLKIEEMTQTLGKHSYNSLLFVEHYVPTFSWLARRASLLGTGVSIPTTAKNELIADNTNKTYR